jgi:hypothetical protein
MGQQMLQGCQALALHPSPGRLVLQTLVILQALLLLLQQ